MTERRVIVIGSGPAGVSACEPLAESGVPVLWLDAGVDYEKADTPREEAPAADAAGLSPRLRYAREREFWNDYARENQISYSNFRGIGSLSRGGLLPYWGAFTPAYDDHDLGNGPLSHSDLSESYREVASRIGISGEATDDLGEFLGSGLPLQPPIELSPKFESLLSRYKSRRGRIGFDVGRARLAVLSRPIGDRPACDLRGTCMLGCDSGALYNGLADVDRLRALPNVDFRSGALVETIEKHEDAYRVRWRDRTSGALLSAVASQVVLAAGVLATSRLALALLERFDEDRALLTTPAVSFALFVPRELGQPVEARNFGLAQLCFRLPIPDRGSRQSGDAFGILYDAAAIPAAELIEHVPLSRPGAISLTRLLASSLVVGLLYFPGEYSANRLTLSGSGTLSVNGGTSNSFPGAMRGAVKRMAAGFRKLGAYLLPFSVACLEPGAEVHYGGTLPMGELTSRDGELLGCPGLHIADASTLLRLPAKQHTFTVMANARRIGKLIAKSMAG